MSESAEERSIPKEFGGFPAELIEEHIRRDYRAGNCLQAMETGNYDLLRIRFRESEKDTGHKVIPFDGNELRSRGNGLPARVIYPTDTNEWDNKMFKRLMGPRSQQSILILYANDRPFPEIVPYIGAAWVARMTWLEEEGIWPPGMIQAAKEYFLALARQAEHTDFTPIRPLSKA